MKILCRSFLLLVLLSSVCFAVESVEVSVEITEINNDKANEFGVKWLDSVTAGEVTWQTANRTPASLPEIPSLISVGDWARFTPLTATLKLLVDKGAAKILSKPKLITKSGSTAKFVVGGEFPIVAAGIGGGSIEWKEYGIKTTITPTVLPNGLIDLTLTTEVSRLDWANKVGDMPAISKREATSSVQIKNGQTLSMAGLLETKKEENVSGIPLLSSIPIIGKLFSNTKIVETKTNVLIFVTPKILEQ